MKKGVVIGIIAGIVLILIIGFFVFANNNSNNNLNNADISENEPQKSSEEKIICNDPPCLGRYFPVCTPAELTMSQGDKSFIISIKGFENEKCHFTMVMDGVTAADCYFKKEQLTDKVLNQMFGNKEGQDAIIAEACGTS
jgi:hypothetical protein